MRRLVGGERMVAKRGEQGHRVAQRGVAGRRRTLKDEQMPAPSLSCHAGCHLQF